MFKHQCEIVSQNFLPSCRSIIATKLIKDHGLKQYEVAKMLGTTQAAISQYLSSKRGQKRIKLMENNPIVQNQLKSIINGLVDRKISTDEVRSKLCDLCIALRK